MIVKKQEGDRKEIKDVRLYRLSKWVDNHSLPER